MFTKGLLKIAANVPGAFVGHKAGLKVFKGPGRVTPSFRPGNPVTGLESLTGANAMETFGRPISRFTNTPRKGLMSMTRVRGSR